MYLKFSKFLRAGRLVWKCSGKGDRLGYEMSGFDPGLRSSLFLTEKLSITGQKCLKMAATFYEGRFASPVLSQTVSAPYRSVNYPLFS